MGITEALLQSLSSVSLMESVAALLLLCVISCSVFRSRRKKKNREPPGPTPLPVLGNLLQLDLKRPHNTLLEFSRKYGPVFTVYFGPKKVVVLAGYEAVKDALVNHDEVFGDRDVLHILHEVNQGGGVLWSNGDLWREMRRFSLTNLRDFGMGKKVCEDKIIEECQHLTDEIKKYNGEAFDTTRLMNYAISNIICSMIFGNRSEYDDAEFSNLVDRLNTTAQLLGSSSMQVYNLFPFCKWISSRRRYCHLSAANRKQVTAFISRLRETLIPQMCRGFVDSFLLRKQNLEESGITDSHFSDKNLLMTVLHLFAAGTETTSTTLRWGLLFMAKYPKIQDRVQEELDRVVGDRVVRVSDRRNLPLTEAVVHETQRLASILPVSLPHKTSRDTTFHGHFISKGTTVYPLLTSVLHDPAEWEKPHSFHPAHFLDKDGNFTKPDAFIPFSAGCRACVGESLARMELFIFFGSLLQRFRFSPPAGVSEEELDLTPFPGITLGPAAHQLRAVSRM
ncbi:cytochrome P450 2K1-like [Menidia menidia]